MYFREMKNQFFFLSLRPAGELPYLFSNVLSLRFSDESGLLEMQQGLGAKFEAAAGNPSGYSLLWSTAYGTHDDAAAERVTDIQYLKASGDAVQEIQWPS